MVASGLKEGSGLVDRHVVAVPFWVDETASVAAGNWKLRSNDG